MSESPEDEKAAVLQAQADALRAVKAAAEERDRIVAMVTALANHEVERASIAAAQIGANRTRIREKAGVSPRVMYEWFERAGVSVRPKRPPEGKS
ncbi:hypothetical protein ACIQPR_48765 [Streptomyces sp. NPDC091280]|uniref:hypothetical protein n=1 Tax=Streptomyces sp. NPDC091280 TaxID=3365984 RepID=UPI00382374B9